MLHRVQLTIGKQHWLAFILVVMGHRVVPLSVVETEHHKRHCADQMFLKGHFLQLGGLQHAFSRKKIVLVVVELLFDFASEHFINYNGRIKLSH
jgi:hypothetical protein